MNLNKTFFTQLLTNIILLYTMLAIKQWLCFQKEKESYLFQNPIIIENIITF